MISSNCSKRSRTMFRLFRRRNDSLELVDSRLYDQDTFYPAFLRDIRQAKRKMIIESPFITLRRFNMLLPALQQARKRGVEIRINTRPPEEHDEPMQREAAEAISLLQKIGVTVFYTGRLHRKIAVIDDEVLWEGSLNILSQWDSCEIMRRTKSHKLAILTLDFIW